MAFIDSRGHAVHDENVFGITELDVRAGLDSAAEVDEVAEVAHAEQPSANAMASKQ